MHESSSDAFGMRWVCDDTVIPAILLLALLFTFIVVLNWTVHDMRKGMTEEEKRAHDEEIDRDLRTW